MNTCFCDGGFAGPACLQRSNRTLSRPGDFTPQVMPEPQPEEDDNPLDRLDTRKRVTKMGESRRTVETGEWPGAGAGRAGLREGWFWWVEEPGSVKASLKLFFGPRILKHGGQGK